MPTGIRQVITLANDLNFVNVVGSRTTQNGLLVKVSDHKHGLVEIDCTGLTLRDGRELATYLESRNSVGEVGLDIDLKGIHSRSPRVPISRFLLLVHMAEVGRGAAVPRAAREFQQDMDRAVEEWMGRFSNRSVAPVNVKADAVL